MLVTVKHGSDSVLRKMRWPTGIWTRVHAVASRLLFLFACFHLSRNRAVLLPLSARLQAVAGYAKPMETDT